MQRMASNFDYGSIEEWRMERGEWSGEWLADIVCAQVKGTFYLSGDDGAAQLAVKSTVPQGYNDSFFYNLPSLKK